jgi:hypothetical protein
MHARTVYTVFQVQMLEIDLLFYVSVVIPPTIATEVISMQNRRTEVISMRV